MALGGETPSPATREGVGKTVRSFKERALRAHWEIAAATVLIVLGGFAVAVGGAALAPDPWAGHSFARLQAVPSGGCLPSAYTSPLSLRIPTGAPNGSQANLSAGSVLGAQFELKASKLPVSSSGTAIFIPPVSAVFPAPSAGSYTIAINALWLNLTTLNSWSAPIGASVALGSALNLSAGTAHLSTSWQAVQAMAPAHSVKLHFQWRWFENVSGTLSYGSWSRSESANNTSAQPTAFSPAPWVGVRSTSGVTAAPGSNYTAKIVGHISSTYFRMIVETSNGHELNTECLYSGPGKISHYLAVLPLVYLGNGTALPAGGYIVHIHDALNAMVVVEKVTVT